MTVLLPYSDYIMLFDTPAINLLVIPHYWPSDKLKEIQFYNSNHGELSVIITDVPTGDYDTIPVDGNVFVKCTIDINNISKIEF